MAQPPAAAAQPPVAAPPARPQAHFNAKPPEPVKLGSDAAANWKLWKQLWSSYAVVADIDDASRTDDFRKALFISTMGIEGLQVYNACDLPTLTRSRSSSVRWMATSWGRLMRLLNDTSSTHGRITWTKRLTHM